MCSMTYACFLRLLCPAQVLVRNVPPDPDESVSELVEHFFMVNHQDHYLTNQVEIRTPTFSFKTFAVCQS